MYVCGSRLSLVELHAFCILVRRLTRQLTTDLDVKTYDSFLRSSFSRTPIPRTTYEIFTESWLGSIKLAAGKIARRNNREWKVACKKIITKYRKRAFFSPSEWRNKERRRSSRIWKHGTFFRKNSFGILPFRIAIQTTIVLYLRYKVNTCTVKRREATLSWSVN